MPSSWVRTFGKRPDARLRMFCFPHAGGGASAYRLWHAGLPSSVEVCAIQLPGREGRLGEAPVRNIEVLVDLLAESLAELFERPFMFFGHSMGAVVAFELARVLAARGEPVPEHLVVSARRPPHLPEMQPPMHLLDDEAFISEIERRYGGIPEEVRAEPDLMAFLLPSLRADIEALEIFKPSSRAHLSMPITVFGGEQDRLVPRAHLEAWRSETAGALRVRSFAGGHFYLQESQPEVLRELSLITGDVVGRLAFDGMST